MVKKNTQQTSSQSQEKSNKVSSNDILSAYLEENKKEHYNFDERIYYKIPFSCIELDELTNGGLEPGVHRFIGPTECGKSSACFDITRNFFERS